jgi:hypothetical protein
MMELFGVLLAFCGTAMLLAGLVFCLGSLVVAAGTGAAMGVSPTLKDTHGAEIRKDNRRIVRKGWKRGLPLALGGIALMWFSSLLL